MVKGDAKSCPRPTQQPVSHIFRGNTSLLPPMHLFVATAPVAPFAWRDHVVAAPGGEEPAPRLRPRPVRIVAVRVGRGRSEAFHVPGVHSSLGWRASAGWESARSSCTVFFCVPAHPIYSVTRRASISKLNGQSFQTCTLEACITLLRCSCLRIVGTEYGI